MREYASYKKSDILSWKKNVIWRHCNYCVWIENSQADMKQKRWIRRLIDLYNMCMQTQQVFFLQAELNDSRAQVHQNRHLISILTIKYAHTYK